MGFLFYFCRNFVENNLGFIYESNNLGIHSGFFVALYFK